MLTCKNTEATICHVLGSNSKYLCIQVTTTCAIILELHENSTATIFNSTYAHYLFQPQEHLQFASLHQQLLRSDLMLTFMYSRKLALKILLHNTFILTVAVSPHYISYYIYCLFCVISLTNYYVIVYCTQTASSIVATLQCNQ